MSLPRGPPNDRGLPSRSRPTVATSPRTPRKCPAIPQPTIVWQTRSLATDRPISGESRSRQGSPVHARQRDRSSCSSSTFRRPLDIPVLERIPASRPAMPTRPGRWRFPRTARSWPRAAMTPTNQRPSSSGMWPPDGWSGGWNAGVGTVSALSFDPKGGILASGHLGKPGNVRLWDGGDRPAPGDPGRPYRQRSHPRLQPGWGHARDRRVGSDGPALERRRPTMPAHPDGPRRYGATSLVQSRWNSSRHGGQRPGNPDLGRRLGPPGDQPALGREDHGCPASAPMAAAWCRPTRTA